MTQLSPPAGTATISTIVVLENARQAEEGSPKTLLFDVHVYMDIFDIDSTANSEGEDSGEDTTPAEKPGTLACLRYFNIHHHVFDAYGPYFIVANIVKVHEGSDKAIPDFPSKDLRVGVDYSLVGDITMVRTLFFSRHTVTDATLPLPAHSCVLPSICDEHIPIPLRHCVPHLSQQGHQNQQAHSATCT
ncbi:hypothetical protein CPC08DRAFT_540161 [Agrocybe pediades]|nr:hypothetical protein CPC08DRAFT_540161 [Agrocybe pediades]